MSIKFINERISKEELQQAANESFVNMAKAVVDINQGVLALGGELHADAEALLLELGSKQEDVWGINIYPDQSKDDRVEFISLINIRPSRGNKTMEVEDQAIRDKIKEIVNKLIE